jgi:hypothetical protein
MRRWLILSIALASIGQVASQARADVLSVLIATNGTFTVAEPPGSGAFALVFSNFGYTAISGNAPLSSAIMVNQIPPSGLDANGNAASGSAWRASTRQTTWRPTSSSPTRSRPLTPWAMRSGFSRT